MTELGPDTGERRHKTPEARRVEKEYVDLKRCTTPSAYRPGEDVSAFSFGEGDSSNYNIGDLTMSNGSSMFDVLSLINEGERGIDVR